MLERWSGIWYNGRESGHGKRSAPPARETASLTPEKPAGPGQRTEKGADGRERYRVLLVDDEEEIRAGISRKIDWDSLGFTLAGEADNGEEALELAELVRPDVVLTDIKMPFMDGLELCRRLKRVLPAAKTVVFSGFDDFEYARQAVGMGVSEYIMKPINAQEMSGVLLRLKDQLDQQQAERRDMESLRRRYEESLPVLRELFYTRLLDGQVRAEQIGDRAARYEIQMPEGPWTVALFDVDSLEEAMDHIARYGTGHSECIVTENEQTAEKFLREVDAAAVYVNASTRFTDGGEFGLGAEIGISTHKLHARGPLGLRELTSYKYAIRGKGQAPTIFSPPP